MTYIATFFSHFDAVCFARNLGAARIPAKARPVPRSVSSSCGTAVEFSTDEAPEALPLGDVHCIFAWEEEGYRLIYEAAHQE